MADQRLLDLRESPGRSWVRANSARILTKARMTYTLISTARSLFSTFAAIKAPCSVKA
ncbi:MAG: hypothetical protein O7C73_00345 [Nitrospirae bacterium]|nr:hypothetical protein [Nitrospirota bacterium]